MGKSVEPGALWYQEPEVPGQSPQSESDESVTDGAPPTVEPPLGGSGVLGPVNQPAASGGCRSVEQAESGNG